jgi:hypothetical protein
VRPALEHAAVDEHLGSIGDEEELGAGDGVGGTKEVDFHGAHTATASKNAWPVGASLGQWKAQT